MKTRFSFRIQSGATPFYFGDHHCSTASAGTRRNSEVLRVTRVWPLALAVPAMTRSLIYCQLRHEGCISDHTYHCKYIWNNRMAVPGSNIVRFEESVRSLVGRDRRTIPAGIFPRPRLGLAAVGGRDVSPQTSYLLAWERSRIRHKSDGSASHPYRRGACQTHTRNRGFQNSFRIPLQGFGKA